jgi:hypothetical protein
MLLMPLPRPALWSVSRQSPNRSSISHTSGSGKRQRSPRGGQMVRMRTISNHRVSRDPKSWPANFFNVAPRALITRFASHASWRAMSKRPALRLARYFRNFGVKIRQHRSPAGDFYSLEVPAPRLPSHVAPNVSEHLFLQHTPNQMFPSGREERTARREYPARPQSSAY